MCQTLNYNNNYSELAFLSSCYKTYCLSDGKMVVTINDNANITCDETGQTINFAGYYQAYSHLSLVCPNIA